MKVCLSLFITLSLLAGNLWVLLESHKFSESVVERSNRLAFLEIACPLLSVLAYASPLGSVLAMLRTADCSDFPIAVIAAQGVQGLACAAYGLHINDGPFFASSAVGLGFQLCWLGAWYWVVSADKDSRYRHYFVHPFLAIAGLAIVFVGIVFLLTLFPEILVGYISCASSLLLCVSPLANLGLIIRSKNSASIPLAMSGIMLLGNAGWTVYGVLLADPFVYLPSIFGFIMTTFQLIVTAWCGGLLPYDLSFLQAMFSNNSYSQVSAVELGRPTGIEEQRQVTPPFA